MRKTTLIACAAATCLTATSAIAQRGDARQRGPARMDESQATSVWTWQAKSFAHDEALNNEATTVLVDAYVDARTQMGAAMSETVQRRGRPDAGERPRRGQPQQRIDTGRIAEIRDEFSSAIDPVLNDEQLDAAIQALGTPNRRIDAMTLALLGIDLDEQTMYDAMTPILEFSAGLAELRSRRDREAMRDGMNGLRQTLSEGLTAALTPEQMVAFREAVGGGEPRDRRGDGRGRRGDRPNAGASIVGESAPAFTLTDSTGETHSLSDLRGRTIVLQWINPDCPVCRRVMDSGRVTSMGKAIRGIDADIVHLTINSTHYMDAKIGEAYLRSHDLAMPVLIDADGAVGKAYGAKTTPHLFVIDGDGIVRYSGAIDDDPPGRKGDDVMNYVVNAVTQLAAGETVSPDATPPYGCRVKYKP